MTQVQDHANERSVAISVKATKMTARLLAQAMQAFIRKARSPTEKHGKQSIKSLTKQGASIDNIEISDDDIGSFKKTARKYNIDFALKKDSSADPPNWIVFFKAKDSKALESAFNEYSKEVLKYNAPKTTMTAEIERFKEIADGLTPAPPAKARSKEEKEL